MIIGIDKGHSTWDKSPCGAIDLLNESKENREIGDRLIEKLRRLGHTVIDCSCNSSSSVNSQLQVIVNKANAQKLDLLCSIHLNAGGGTGAEIYTTSTSGAKEIAKRVLESYVNKTGFKNRGHKYAEYYVLRNTVDPAILLEMCFVDNKEDEERWGHISYDTIVDSIVDGILGETVVVNQDTEKPSEPIRKITYLNPQTYSPWVVRLQSELNRQSFGVISIDGYVGPKTLDVASRCPIYEGISGRITLLLQEMLKDLRYYSGNLDSSCGPEMVEAIKKWQSVAGLDADGSFGPASWKALFSI